ncbi:MAG: patatin-like phospholipase family protein [Eubacteriales bacterium]|nr:patatin-like phospholipase family protein [Eubacteriales bacterium]
MQNDVKPMGLTLSGGGVKGIAYVGMQQEAEKRKISWENVAGVSIGSLAGALIAAGYSSAEMWNAMDKFDFKGIQLRDASKLPVVESFREFAERSRSFREQTVKDFLYSDPTGRRDSFTGSRDSDKGMSDSAPMEQLVRMLNNIVEYSSRAPMFDGGIVEEWTAECLAKKGIRTFGDVRGGISDSSNPNGYKIRMTAIDCNRVKTVVLPDDLAYYGIDPDSFEIATAVRMSTCVPFAFKPVVIQIIQGNKIKKYNLVDGGVFDTFPFWLINNEKVPSAGFELTDGKQKFFSLDTGLSILRTLISLVHNTNTPKKDFSKINYFGEIDTSRVKFLDFNLDDEEKTYLFNSGRKGFMDAFKRRVLKRQHYGPR